MDLRYVGPLFQIVSSKRLYQCCETNVFCIICKPTPHPGLGLGLDLDEMQSIQLHGIDGKYRMLASWKLVSLSDYTNGSGCNASDSTAWNRWGDPCL